jgi:hypothetical protein
MEALVEDLFPKMHGPKMLTHFWKGSNSFIPKKAVVPKTAFWGRDSLF